jgi:hypothetical protein
MKRIEWKILTTARIELQCRQDDDEEWKILTTAHYPIGDTGIETQERQMSVRYINDCHR